VFCELGPEPVLCRLGPRTIDSAGVHWLPTLQRGRPELRSLLDTIANLYTNGLADVHWEALHRAYPQRRISLPTYPFQRQPLLAPDPEARAEQARTSPQPVDSVPRGAASHPFIDQQMAPQAMGETHDEAARAGACPQARSK
jgi:acyl transferase domain-containing protein